MTSPEPWILQRGKRFHERVQSSWEDTAEGDVTTEHQISLIPGGANRERRGRLDLFVHEVGDFVVVVEIKSTDWDQITNVSALLGSHRRQVWKYIEKYLDSDEVDVVAGIIYPRAPESPALQDRIESYLSEYGLQVVWYDDP